MNAYVEQDGEIHIVHLSGKLDYEVIVPFQKTCQKYLVHHQTVLSLKSLAFVGSHGITDFLDCLVELNSNSIAGVKFADVSVEFRRLLESAQDKTRFQIYESVAQAKQSFLDPKIIPLPNIYGIEIDEEGQEELLTFDGVTTTEAGIAALTESLKGPMSSPQDSVCQEAGVASETFKIPQP